MARGLQAAVTDAAHTRHCSNYVYNHGHCVCNHYHLCACSSTSWAGIATSCGVGYSHVDCHERGGNNLGHRGCSHCYGDNDRGRRGYAIVTAIARATVAMSAAPSAWLPRLPS